MGAGPGHRARLAHHRQPTLAVALGEHQLALHVEPELAPLGDRRGGARQLQQRPGVAQAPAFAEAGDVVHGRPRGHALVVAPHLVDVVEAALEVPAALDQADLGAVGRHLVERPGARRHVGGPHVQHVAGGAHDRAVPSGGSMRLARRQSPVRWTPNAAVAAASGASSARRAYSPLARRRVASGGQVGRRPATTAPSCTPRRAGRRERTTSPSRARTSGRPSPSRRATSRPRPAASTHAAASSYAPASRKRSAASSTWSSSRRRRPHRGSGAPASPRGRGRAGSAGTRGSAGGSAGPRARSSPAGAGGGSPGRGRRPTGRPAGWPGRAAPRSPGRRCGPRRPARPARWAPRTSAPRYSKKGSSAAVPGAARRPRTASNTMPAAQPPDAAATSAGSASTSCASSSAPTSSLVKASDPPGIRPAAPGQHRAAQLGVDGPARHQHHQRAGRHRGRQRPQNGEHRRAVLDVVEVVDDQRRALGERLGEHCGAVGGGDAGGQRAPGSAPTRTARCRRGPRPGRSRTGRGCRRPRPASARRAGRAGRSRTGRPPWSCRIPPRRPPRGCGAPPRRAPASPRPAPAR